MERITKVLLVMVVFMVMLASEVEGGRGIKSNDKLDHPQTFFGGTGVPFPGSGIGGTFPSPGFTGTFPSPLFRGSFPSPGFTGTFPSPGFSGTFPSLGFGFSPPSFCSVTGIGCVPTRSTIPGGVVGGGHGSKGSP